MRSLVKFTAYSIIVALAAAFIVSCEDSALLAPTDGVFTVAASPDTLVIDEPGGETCATTMISAQIFDAGNYPMEGVEITFTTDGGTLLEVEPSDTDTDAECGVDDANAGTVTLAVETDVRGTAVVFLTITLNDADETTVSARSGTIVESAVVTLSITPENQLPEAFITADPEDTQIFNRSILFDGRSSADPDGDQITCWKWTITSDLLAVAPVVLQGPGQSTVLESYSEEQVLDVELRVSDNPGLVCDQCEGSPGLCGASDAAFGDRDVIIGYEIVCDRFDPVADAGPDLTRTLDSGQTGVLVDLDGRNSTGGDSGIDTYSWSCNGVTQPDGAQVQCTFTQGTHYPTLTVINGCGKSDSDTAVVTVLPAV